MSLTKHNARFIDDSVSGLDVLLFIGDLLLLMSKLRMKDGCGKGTYLPSRSGGACLWFVRY